MNYYDGLRSYQIADVLNAAQPAWNLWYEPRLGKTRTAGRLVLRWTFDFGFKTHLIVGPLTPLQITWMREMRAIGFELPSRGGGSAGYLIPLLEPPSRSVSTMLPPRVRTKKDGTTELTHDPSKVAWVGHILRDLAQGAANGRPVVILINDDLFRYSGRFGARGGKKSIADLLCDLKPDTLIRDESDRDSNPGSRRALALRRIARYTKRRRSLTGTPDPNGYENLFSQFAILDPDLFGTNRKRFMERYVVTRDIYGRDVIGYQNVDELFTKIRSCSSIVRAMDYFDVPPVEEIERHIELRAYPRSLYNELKRTSILETEQFNIDATHQLAKLTRLSQLALGYLPVDDPDNARMVEWVHNDKIDSVVADCAEPLASGQKIVISHQWRPEGERVVEALRDRYGERTVVSLNGRTLGDRTAIVAPFDIDQSVESDARIIVAQETTGGVGISFARADHLHFLSWSFDYGDVFQMHKRTWAEGKRRLTETFHIADGTIDVYKRRMIQQKADASVMLRAVGFRNAAEGKVD